MRFSSLVWQQKLMVAAASCRSGWAGRAQLSAGRSRQPLRHVVASAQGGGPSRFVLVQREPIRRRLESPQPMSVHAGLYTSALWVWTTAGPPRAVSHPATCPRFWGYCRAEPWPGVLTSEHVHARRRTHRVCHISVRQTEHVQLIAR